MFTNTNINLCNNCGKQGHLFYQCKLPITSYGIILFHMKRINHKINNTIEEYENDTNIQFLMIRRKNTFGYIDFIRGKYSPFNEEHIQSIVNEMSLIEKNNILEETFANLWKKMWGETMNIQHKNEEIVSSKKFEYIKNGITINDDIGDKITLDEIIQNSTTHWEETEWEFPKGRRNYDEKDLVCALREFEEETGISQSSIKLIENIMPFEETFIGTNHKSYKHKYFLAYIDNITDDLLDNYQKAEVSKIEWKTYSECLECIRPYNLEKKQLVERIYKIIKEYTLY